MTMSALPSSGQRDNFSVSEMIWRVYTAFG
jgi:hypothetical protein